MFTNLKNLHGSHFADHNFSDFSGYIVQVPKSQLEALIELCCGPYDPKADPDECAEAGFELSSIFDNTLNSRACTSFFRAEPHVPAIERDYYLSKLWQFLWLIAVASAASYQNFNQSQDALTDLLDSIPDARFPELAYFDWQEFQMEVCKQCRSGRGKGEVLGPLGDLHRFLPPIESPAATESSLSHGDTTPVPQRLISQRKEPLDPNEKTGASSDPLQAFGRSGKRRGRRGNEDRRDAIRRLIVKYGEEWRDHLSDMFHELDSSNVQLGAFEGKKISVGDDQTIRASKWADLELAEGDQRSRIIDALRKYAE
jgi:hypothetical protein